MSITSKNRTLETVVWVWLGLAWLQLLTLWHLMVSLVHGVIDPAKVVPNFGVDLWWQGYKLFFLCHQWSWKIGWSVWPWRDFSSPWNIHYSLFARWTGDREKRFIRLIPGLPSKQLLAPLLRIPIRVQPPLFLSQVTWKQYWERLVEQLSNRKY